MASSYILHAHEHRQGQRRWLTEWHTTEAAAWLSRLELEALGWAVSVTCVPAPSSGRTVIACGGQLPPRAEG